MFEKINRCIKQMHLYILYIIFSKTPKQMEQKKRNHFENFENGSSQNLDRSDSSVNQHELNNRKIGNRRNGKRIVKYVHTCCITYIDREGKRQTRVQQMVKCSRSRDQQQSKSAAMKQAVKFNANIIQNAQNRTDFCPNIASQKPKAELELNIPFLPFYSHPMQYFYLI